MVSRSVIAAAALVVAAQAQSATSQAMPAVATQAFNAAPITSAQRFDWCRAQLNTCPQICGGRVTTNNCDQAQLTYECVCLNGTVPDCTAYQSTLPFFICQATYAQCIAASPDNAQAQEVCTANEQCGNLTARPLGAAASSSVASSISATQTSTETASNTASSTAQTSSGIAAPNQQVATGAFAAVLLAAFGFLL